MINIVNIINDNNYDLNNFANDAKIILDCTLKTINNPNFSTSEIAIILVDEIESQAINNKYRKKDYIADVISFPNIVSEQLKVIAEENGLPIDLGDIYICFPKAQKQAIAYGHSLRRELAFLFLHGLLHNLGYDHQTVDQETVMFNLQRTILNKVNIKRSEN